MFVRVERGSSVPVSRQIAGQIRALCLSGGLKPGERLPSVRELARDLAVNVNTVVRVYESLAADRLVEMRHGDGTYVLPPAAGAARADLESQRAAFEREFAALVRRGVLLGLSAADLRRALAAAVEAAKADAARVSEAPSPKKKA